MLQEMATKVRKEGSVDASVDGFEQEDGLKIRKTGRKGKRRAKEGKGAK